jgi:amino acid permease
MVSWPHRAIQSLSVHIVIACWIYVIAMVALAMRSALAGVATFLLVGCAPVLLYTLLALQRRRSRRDPRARGTRSGLKHEVHDGDDRDA